MRQYFQICIFYLFFLLAFGCGRNERKGESEIPVNQGKPVPDYVLKEVTHYHYEEGVLKFELTFNEGEFYADSEELYIDNCNYIYYDIDETIISRGRSNKAKVLGDQSIIIAENDVIIISEVNGGVLETDYLEWHGKKEQFVTDYPVTITRKNGDIISGNGMVADIALQYVTIQENVRGSFSGSQD